MEVETWRSHLRGVFHLSLFLFLVTLHLTPFIVALTSIMSCRGNKKHWPESRKLVKSVPCLVVCMGAFIRGTVWHIRQHWAVLCHIISTDLQLCSLPSVSSGRYWLSFHSIVVPLPLSLLACYRSLWSARTLERFGRKERKGDKRERVHLLQSTWRCAYSANATWWIFSKC